MIAIELVSFTLEDVAILARIINKQRPATRTAKATPIRLIQVFCEETVLSKKYVISFKIKI